MNIIGFDPGYGLIGWGVITPDNSVDNMLKVVAYGAINTPANLPFPRRLLQIQDEVNALLNEYSPSCAVIEKLFFKKNVKTAADVFQARGVILASIAGFGCEIFEMSPNQIKLMVCGHGRAQKNEVAIMVKRLLNIQHDIKYDDTSDALAGAIAGSAQLRSERLLSKTGDMRL